MDKAATVHAPSSAPILVVEDDSTIREVLEYVFDLEGMAVESVADGGQALEYLAHTCPSLIVLDIVLPIVDGFGVADGARAFYGMSVPIVVLTANGHPDEAGARVGAVAALHKPFELQALVRIVGAILAEGRYT